MEQLDFGAAAANAVYLTHVESELCVLASGNTKNVTKVLFQIVVRHGRSHDLVQLAAMRPQKSIQTIQFQIISLETHSA